MNLNKLLELTKEPDCIQGLWGSAKGWFLSEWARCYKRPAIILCKGPLEAEAVFYDLQTFYGKDVVLFPEEETGNLDLIGERWCVLENPASLIVTTIHAVKQLVVPPEKLPQIRFGLKTKDNIIRKELFKWLIDNGYDRTDTVEYKGEFAHRGGIIDIYPPNSDWPLRIELIGDVIESIRPFHPQTQCSLPRTFFDNSNTNNLNVESHTKVRGLPEEEAPTFIYPVILKKNSDEYVYLEQYLPKNGVIVLNDLEEDIPEFPERELMTLTGLTKDLSKISVQIQSLEHLTTEKKTPDMLTVARKRTFLQISRWCEEGYSVNVYCNNKGEKERLEELLKEHKIKITKTMNICIGRISSGFMYSFEKLVVISDEEIFGRYKVRLPRRKFKGYGAPIKEFSELKPGDYVVHVNHGIGKYLGLKKEKQGEMLVIQYANKAKLYVPIDEIQLVERYMGLGGRIPKLNILGGTRWMKTKIKVERALMDVASELLNIQAKRQSLPGISFSKDVLWQKEMEDAFIYEETPDQLQAAVEVKRDMEQKRPMDRLLCGDVGYGKTEVAIRAAFKAVMDGKQVAVLVPTTILAQQHYRTFSERLADYPVSVEMISRFRTNKEQKAIIETVAKAKIDILIGTHRIIQQDIKFKELGLVIIDEEQRFGVRHKEKLKRLRAIVDVLTLTATPIPRTLYMSLVGIRDMSVINTPPQDRLAVKTILLESNDKVIREAITREIRREGQVYFLHNRVETIDKVADKLKKLVPEAKFLIAHGQMDEDLLALVMDEFVQGRVDVLVCTTIIQSGLDIPNVNTIIIDRADRFGLADLYQLRGRVGRFRHQAYAYLLLPENKVLVSAAKKRLKAIQDFSHLGAGFKIAMQDLEIRGAGNLLGHQQHGHIQAIGFDLYCKLLHRNVLKLQGKTVKESYEVLLDLDFNGYISVEYIPSDRIRIKFYKRLAGVLDDSELDTIIDEFKDRFGKLPESVKVLLEIIRIKLFAMKLRVKEIRVINNKLNILFLCGRRMVFDMSEVKDKSSPCAQGLDKLGWLKKKIYGIMPLKKEKGNNA